MAASSYTCNPMIDKEQYNSLHDFADSLHKLNVTMIEHEGSSDVYRNLTDKIEAMTNELSCLPARARVYDKQVFYKGPDRIPEIAFGNQKDFSPVSGFSNAVAPSVFMEMVAKNYISGSVHFSSVYQGGPGLVHGGFIAAIFDELLGKVQAQLENPGMTANLTVQYLRPCPINSHYHLEGKVVKVEGRKILTKGSMNLNGEKMAIAKAIFVGRA